MAAKEKSPQALRQQLLVSHVRQLIEPLCIEQGLELVHVEYLREPAGRTLRLYADKPGGVTLDDCAGLSRQASDLLDVALDLDEAYRLEVSSPGMDRPLGKIEDYDRFEGEQAKIRTASPIDGQKNFTGTINGRSDQIVELMVQDRVVAIAFADITKAHLINYNGENGCL